jgi:GrpB-like predicted nucleotidyltransferase (UPF0157 family)
VSSEEYSDQKLAEVTVGECREVNSTINLVEYDPAWPRRFKEIETQVRGALGDLVVMLEHAGSTSVPGLSAKPIIDIVLEVESAAGEQAYIPALENTGFTLRIREPGWFEHRLLELEDVNLHVFSANCEESARMLRFRDWLRSNADDRRLYQQTKVALAKQIWKYTQNYADAKTAVVEEIMSRAISSTGRG